MESSFTFSGIATLFGVLLILAFVPGISSVTVSVRAVSAGLKHAVFTTFGIVAGDLLFILIAIYGLSLLSAWLGERFVLLRIAGGAWLIWLGIGLWRAKARAGDRGANNGDSLLSSFLSGLLITLGDQKAILFYLGLFPAFLDLSSLTLPDTGLVLVTATAAVGIPKLLYALLAARAGTLFAGARAAQAIRILAGGVLCGLGFFLLATA